MDASRQIAIVGIGCRFPGGAASPEQFWDLLVEGRDAIGEWPAERGDPAHVFDADPSVPGKLYVNRGGFIDDPGAFDTGFFAMSPREAVHVDPQHRLLLELAYEALEDGGIPVESVAGSDTGVFVGICSHDYGDIQVYPSNRALIDGHSNSGSALSLAANRISYMFDLLGPSMIVDTACSSSLTAVHLAVGSLRRGECGVALVGGVQLVLTPEQTIGFCKATMLSPDGRCAAFDASANGYVRSEGGAVVVLKPLADALVAGDRIYAVIAGTAINQDGRTVGITVPSSTGQEAVVRAALDDAGIDPSAVGYVEAHGTGTPVGDPIEANALGAVFGPAQAPGQACAVGSAKTNLGHLEAASGMAGLCKAVLSVQRGEVPASLHFVAPNPEIDFERLRLRVVTEQEPWPGPEPRVAGINSFGFGGANAHVVVTAVPAAAAEPASKPGAAAPTVLLPLSARTPEALAGNVRALADHLCGPGAALAGSLDEVCRTAARRRSHHEHRWVGVASDAADMAELLDASSAGERRAATARGRAVAGGPPVAFVFAGMGPLWWGMARQLLVEEPVYASVVARCDEALRTVTTWSLLAELHKDEDSSRVADADLAQVTNFAVQMGLVALWEHWGVRAGAVVGHSGGEVAAACTAGALTLEEGAVLTWHRGRIQSRASGEGGMLGVGLGGGRHCRPPRGPAGGDGFGGVPGGGEQPRVGDPFGHGGGADRSGRRAHPAAGVRPCREGGGSLPQPPHGPLPGRHRRRPRRPPSPPRRHPDGVGGDRRLGYRRRPRRRVLVVVRPPAGALRCRRRPADRRRLSDVRRDRAPSRPQPVGGGGRVRPGGRRDRPALHPPQGG